MTSFDLERFENQQFMNLETFPGMEKGEEASLVCIGG